MSDSSHTSSPKRESTPGKTRSILLLAILAVLLVALGFDYLVARPRVTAAYDKVAERHMEVNATANEILTDEDVHELLGKQPSRSFQDGVETVEVFSWASGVPFRTHDLFVVYQPSGGQQMFRRHSKFVYDPTSEVSRTNNLVEADEEMEAAHREAMEAYDGGRQPGGAGESAPGAGPGDGGEAAGAADRPQEPGEAPAEAASDAETGGDAASEASAEAAGEPPAPEGDEETP